MGSSSSKPIPSPCAAPRGEDDAEKNLSARTACLSLNGLATPTVPTPTSLDGTLTLSNLDAWESTLASNPKTHLARTVLHHNTLPHTLVSRDAQVADVHVFNHQLKFETNPITNQKNSGRCWLFATTNVIRYDVMKKLNLSEFQLSQSYPFFYDKLNKSNYYLELSIQHAELPIDDRLIVHLADDLISDGGQWDMSVNILDSYGVVPQSIYPESATSSSSNSLNDLLKTKLREHALILRKLHSSLKEAGSLSPDAQVQVLRAKKEELLCEIYSVMTATLGKPPRPDEPFIWEYYDANGKAERWEGTPKQYFKAFASKQYSPLESFSLINDPRNEYGNLYTVDKLGNIVGGRPVLYVNTEVKAMKDMIIKMIKAGQPVFFGCDVGASSDSQKGIMDTALFDYEGTFDISLGLTKAERLQVKESAMTHAMVISGVHLANDGTPVRYKVENS